jgi:hypothetical protein
MTPNGPKIEFKEGTKLYANHFLEPGFARILFVAGMTAPDLIDNAMVITSLYRTGSGYHPKFRAIDIRSGVFAPALRGAIVAPTDQKRLDMGKSWAQRMRLRLGYEYDVVFGQDDDHLDHFHIEHDARKELIYWKQSDGNN